MALKLEHSNGRLAARGLVGGVDGVLREEPGGCICGDIV